MKYYETIPSTPKCQTNWNHKWLLRVEEHIVWGILEELGYRGPIQSKIGDEYRWGDVWQKSKLFIERNLIEISKEEYQKRYIKIKMEA